MSKPPEDIRTGMLPCHADERGYLIPVEFSGMPFIVKRSFLVVAPDQTRRGCHAPGCRQLMVLGAGKVHLTIIARGTEARFQLSDPGEYVLLEADDYIEYEMIDPASVIMVLADAPYADSVQGR